MPHKSPEALQAELEKAKAIIDTRPDLFSLSLEKLDEKLSNDSNDIYKNKLSIFAILFVKQIQDFSYDSLSTKLANENISKYACRHIMFLLQKQHHISCFPLMEYAIAHNTIVQLMPFISHNIIYESIIDKPTLQRFLNNMHFIPQSNQMYIFQDTAELIYSCQLTDEAFSYLFTQQPHLADAFAPYLLGVLYQHDREIGDKRLSSLLSINEPSLWLNTIIAGISISLKHDTNMFEQNFSQLAIMSNDLASWEKLIPCYVEYALCPHRHSDSIISQVYKKLHSLTGACAKTKYIFIQSITYSKDWSPILHSIFVKICQEPLSTDPKDLEEVSSYFQLKKSYLSIDSIISLLNNLFLHNGYNLSNYDSFFHSFDNIQNDLSAYPNLYQKFVYYFTQPNDVNLAFSLGLFEYILSFSLSNSEEVLSINETPVLSLLIIKILTVFIQQHSIDLLCYLSFVYMCQIPYNDEQQNEILNLLYQSYPESLYKAANSVLSNDSLRSMHKIAEVIIDHIDDLKKWKKTFSSNPDLYPSTQRQEMLRKSILERNRRINKKVDEESFFTHFFPTKHMKYGKRNAFVRPSKDGQYDYLSNNYHFIECSIEPHIMKILSPIDLVIQRQKYKKERDEYIEIHNSGLH